MEGSKFLRLFSEFFNFGRYKIFSKEHLLSDNLNCYVCLVCQQLYFVCLKILRYFKS